MNVQEYMDWIDTPIGGILIKANEIGITEVAFMRNEKKENRLRNGCPLLEEAKHQLTEYFLRKRKSFELPLSQKGTPFQVLDWKALCTIPYGETRSYKQIAEQIGHPNAYRAVGMANHNNSIAIIVPCHRVIGNDGSLGGYGAGIDIKKYLLELEKN